MPKTVLVCQNADCKSRGAGEIMEVLQRELNGCADAEVKQYMCFGACQSGPNIVVYPDKVWYCGVKTRDAEEIAAHVRGGPVVERLTGGVDRPLQELIYQLLDAGLY